jgi:serine/threonine-protein kinase RsbW
LPALRSAAKSTMSTEPNTQLPGNEPPSSTHFDVTLPAQISAISPVVTWIMRLVGELDYAAGKEFEIEMALREALANAVLHGCQEDPSKKVECSVSADRDEGITIVVRDPGNGFDPATLPSPTEDANLHAEHGRGILLITKLMDEVKHEQNGAVIRMRKF